MDAAAVARVAEEPSDIPLDPTDAARRCLDSDNEEGPADVDEEEDAMPPGGLPAEVNHAEAMDVEEAPANTPAPAEVHCAPELPVDIKTLKVAELKTHLWWRTLPTAGKKDELQMRLQKAIDDKTPLRHAADAANAPAAVESAASQWEPLDSSKITRPAYTGSEKFVPNPSLGLTPHTHPFEYMNSFYPKKMRDQQVKNSELYRGYVKMQDKEVYKGLPDISAHTNSLAHSVLLLQGLNPVPDQRRMFKKSFAYKDHRSADLLTRDEWAVWKAYFHVSDPRNAPKFGTKEWDELHKIRPMLDEYLRNCIRNVSGGRVFSIDEITIGFQGHHSRLKLRCGKFKRAGDGFQVWRTLLTSHYDTPRADPHAHDTGPGPNKPVCKSQPPPVRLHDTQPPIPALILLGYHI